MTELISDRAGPPQLSAVASFMPKPAALPDHPGLAGSLPPAPEDLARLASMGVTGASVLLRRGRVINDGNGLFHHHPRGVPTWLLPVLADAPDQVSAERAPWVSSLAGRQVLDVVAIVDGPRGPVLLADGAVDFLGNLPAILNPLNPETPMPAVRVFGSVHDWLRQFTRSGIVLLG
jgi:hypothetical protein